MFRPRRIFNLESAYLTRIGQVIGFVCKEGLYMTFGFKNASADLCGQGLSNRRKDKFSLQYKCYFFFRFFQAKASSKRARSAAVIFSIFSAPSLVTLVSRSSPALRLPSLALKTRTNNASYAG